jgi:hypothetical protein
VSSRNGAGSAKSFLRRNFRYKTISLTVLVDFADREPDTHQFEAVAAVVRRIRVSPG